MRASRLRAFMVGGVVVTVCCTITASASRPNQVVGTWAATTTTSGGETFEARMSFLPGGEACTLTDDETAMASSGTWRGTGKQVHFRVKEDFLDAGTVFFTIDTHQRGIPSEDWLATGNTRMISPDGTTTQRVTTKFTRISATPERC